jgi:hypothetical protein
MAPPDHHKQAVEAMAKAIYDAERLGTQLDWDQLSRSVRAGYERRVVTAHAALIESGWRPPEQTDVMGTRQALSGARPDGAPMTSRMTTERRGDFPGDRDCTTHHICVCKERELERLREALEWYGDAENHRWDWGGDGSGEIGRVAPTHRDGGRKARAALSTPTTPTVED